VGVVLSTLHQSSLGALFLIVPGKLHPLWYTELLPLLFYVSAICMGLAMVILISRLTAKAFRRTLETPILARLARILAALLWVYGVTRLFDLGVNGGLAHAFAFDYESFLFLVEFGLGVGIPAALLAIPTVRASPGGLYAASVLVVFGFLANRLNVSITGFEQAQGGHYVPAWAEVFITLMVVAGAFAAYALAVRYLDVYPEVTKRRAAAVGSNGHGGNGHGGNGHGGNGHEGNGRAGIEIPAALPADLEGAPWEARLGAWAGGRVPHRSFPTRTA